jgi:hypothetical protein
MLRPPIFQHPATGGDLATGLRFPTSAQRMPGMLLALLGSAGAFWLGLNVFWLNTTVVLASVAAAIVLCGLGWLAEVHTRTPLGEPRSSAPVADDPGAVLALGIPIVLLAFLGVAAGLMPTRLFLVVWVGMLGGYVLRVAWMSWHRRWFTVAQMIVLGGPLGLITFAALLLDSCQHGSCL